ncbi:MAG: PIN domain-containing protein [Kiritimatiellia bacterium]
MNFWDSSAITPLIVSEASSPLRCQQYRDLGAVTVWYGTLLEIESALARKLREESVPSAGIREARTRLRSLAETWDEVTPGLQLRERATRLLYTHSLRAADAFQLAAALVASREAPAGHRFLTGDIRLKDAAEREGFTVC